MADSPRAGPPVPGSGCGFGMAGSAVGLFTGLAWFAAELGSLSPAERAGLPGGTSYPYILLTIPIGFVLGVVAGIEYARWGRRPELRRPATPG